VFCSVFVLQALLALGPMVYIAVLLKKEIERANTIVKESNHNEIAMKREKRAKGGWVGVARTESQVTRTDK